MARIIPFPVTAQDSEVSAAAAALSRLHGEAANAFWRQTIARLRQQLSRNGVRPEESDVELRAFSAEVFARIREAGRPAQSDMAG